VKGNQRCQKILADGQTLLEVVGGRLRSVFLPMVQTIGNHFLSQARKLENFVAPNLRSVGCNFLFENKGIKIYHCLN